MTEIDDIPFEPESKPIKQPPSINDRQVCSECGVSKLLSEFSLKVGKTSDLRKTFCTKCEHGKRKTRKRKFGIDDSEWEILLKLPCCICGGKAEVVNVSGMNPNSALPLGVLCSPCFKIVQPNSAENLERIEKALNYMLITRDFPFWNRAILELKSNIKLQNETPLLDFANET